MYHTYHRETATDVYGRLKAIQMASMLAGLAFVGQQVSWGVPSLLELACIYSRVRT